MLGISIVLCLVSAILAKELNSGIPNADHIHASLSKQQWDPDETECRDRIFKILENVKNSILWAIWVWNSMEQSPVGTFWGSRYHLGSYDQCLRPPWLPSHPELRMQYCLAEIEMNDGRSTIIDKVTDPYATADEYLLETRTSSGRVFSYTVHGICLPAGCPTKSVEKFTKALLSTGHLRAAKGVAVSIHHCEEAGAPHEYSMGYYAYMYTFAALLFMAVASTYYVSEYSVTASSNSFVNHVAKSFCLRRNWDTVVKEDKDAIMCLHGIRFLTATMIACFHSLAILQGTSVRNGLDLELLTRNVKLAVVVMHFDVFVDTFFAISALLLGKSLRTLDITKPYCLIKNILKRYIRLIGPFAVTVFYMAYVSMHTDDGPLYPKIALVEQQACEKNWWLALLMVGNYFNTSEMCHPATWYIPCDFHFYAITLTLLYVYRKSPRAGKLATAVVIVAGFLSPAISAYVYDLYAVIAYNLGSDINIRTSKGFIYGYSRTHNRMGPYVAGLAVGYMMSIYKPKHYKKVWNKSVSFLGAYAFLNLMLGVLALGWLCFMYKVEGLLACVFLLFNRTAFAIAVLGVIVFCTYGDVPLINSFLSWKLFAPLSRLSYGVYVIHLLILYRGISSIRDNVKHQMFDILVSSLGLVVVSLVLSLTVWLLVEAPLINITNRYLNTKTSTNEKVEASRSGVSQNGTDKQKNK